VVVTLSANSSAASVPAGVTVPEGSSSATFTIITNLVSSLIALDISATYGGVTRSLVLTVTSEPNNLPPVSMDDTYTASANTAMNQAAPGVLSNDTDPEGATFWAVLVDGPSNGILTLNADGSFSYIPTSNYVGSDSFTYMVNDGANSSNVATVAISVVSNSTNLGAGGGGGGGCFISAAAAANDEGPVADLLKRFFDIIFSELDVGNRSVKNVPAYPCRW